MENGKQSFDQRSDSTKTIEDRDYFTLGPNIFSRSNYAFLMKCLGNNQEAITKRTVWPAKIDPYWIDQLKEGWKQWRVTIDRDRKVQGILEVTRLALYYPNSSPYCWWFASPTSMIVVTLAKDKEQAETHANKVLTQQYLNPKWLAMKDENDFYYSSPTF